MFEFTLPSLGADMDQGRLLEWLVQPGDTVHKGQVIAVVDTAKAAIDVETWHEGVVHELLTTPGEVVLVGAAMARLLAPGEAAPEPGRPAAVASEMTPVEAPTPVEVPSAPRPAGTPPPAAPGGAHVEVGGERRRVSPAARKHAEQLGVDLALVVGTGPLGAVTLTDVDQAAAVRSAPAAPAPAAPPPPSPAPAAVTPADRQAQIRQAIAAAMSRSKREIPHYYLSQTIPMERATLWLTAQNADRPITERVLMAVVLLKAVARALAEYPQLNGHFVDGTFRPAPVAHLGVAIALRHGGLVAPALHDVAATSMPDLMRELSDLVARARAASLRSSEMSDPTITVSNLGDQGVETVFGVITPPQVALVGFGRVAPRPWVRDGGLFVIPTVTASLAADHRTSDGHTGAMFLTELSDWLQRPEDL